MIDVQVATLADVDMMADVVVKTWKSAYKGLVSQSFLYKLDTKLYTQRFKRYIISRKKGLLYAKQDGVIVGVLQASEDTDVQQVTIHLLYVLPNAQGIGVGTALLQACLATFNEYSTFVLDVLVNNHQAKQFYCAVGFQLSGEQRKSEIHGGVCYVEQAVLRT